MKLQAITHAYVHWLADVQFGSFAPAFTLSLCDSEYARKLPMPIASVVSSKPKKIKNLIMNLAFLFLSAGLFGCSIRSRKDFRQSALSITKLTPGQPDLFVSD